LGFIARGRGRPSGIERFEDAYVVGELNPSNREVPLGGEMVLETEIANVGKGPATLLKVTGLVPGGFELAQNGSKLVEGGVDLNGRRLEQLKTHQLKLSLKPTRQGSFEVRPRVFFADDSGNYRSYQFRPVSLTVVEPEAPSLGVPTVEPPRLTSITLPDDIQFESSRSGDVFLFLIRQFVRDHMTKRIVVDKAGWRTLMDVVRELDLPRSALYGPLGKDGPVLRELERRGFVETRIFPKERGRGGAVKRTRVAYENVIVKRIVEKIVVQSK